MKIGITQLCVPGTIADLFRFKAFRGKQDQDFAIAVW